jgi:hypothetical protein
MTIAATAALGAASATAAAAVVASHGVQAASSFDSPSIYLHA